MINISKLPKVVTQKSKRVGRGPGSGSGKNAGKGHKGQTKHGGKRPVGFEGGQTRLIKRTPKFRGFTPRENRHLAVVTLVTINRAFADGETVSLKTLLEKGVINEHTKQVRVIKSGELTVKVTFAQEEALYLTKGVQSITK